jgi:hypothetical protein
MIQRKSRPDRTGAVFIGEAIYEELPGFLTPQQVTQEVDAELGTAFDRTEAVYCGFGEDPEEQATRDRVGYHVPTQPIVWDFDPSNTFNPYLFR